MATWGKQDVKVFTWDREGDPESVDIELPGGLRGRDLADLAELRVQDVWEQDCELPFKREVLDVEGVCVMNWISGNPFHGPTYKITIVLCPGNDALAEKYMNKLVKMG